MGKKFFSILLCLILGIVTAFAQRQVTGTIVDKGGNPVPGAAIVISGSTVGTVSDTDGKFSINASPENTLNVSSIGYKGLSIQVGDQTVLRIVLEEDSELLDEVVVTALGVTRQEKTLGYSATTVKSDELVSARTTNAINAISGKVAGVQVQSTSSDPGATSNIIIRGFSSINGSNQPLYVVDGVPLSTSSISSSSGEKSSTISGISNISPEDIESMTILKGAAATALYGSRAANGVIVVTTKSGKKGESRNFSITYNGGLKLRQVSVLPTFQNDFGQGWNGTQTYIENGSWGPRLDGSIQVYGPIWNHQQRIHEYSAKKNNIKDFFEIGVSQNHDIAFSGVSNDNRASFYLSYSYNDDDGIMPDDYDVYTRNTVAARGSYEATKWLKISSSINFARATSKVVDTDQGTSVIDGLYEFPRDISLVDMKDLSVAFNTPEAYFTPYGITNPYWALANNYDKTNSQQINGKIQLDVTPIEGLVLTYRMGFDYSNYDNKRGVPEIDLDDALINEDYGYAPSHMNQSGSVTASYGKMHEINHDFMANYTKKFLDDRLSLNALAGLNINERGGSSMGATTSTLTFDTGFWDLSNGADKTSISEQTWKRRLVGLFADVTIGWNDEVYLDLTARNDWSSTLPIDDNSYFYPGATLSWIFSQRLNWEPLSFGKLRLAYGKTGNDAGVYETSAYYTQAYTNGYYLGNIVTFPLNNVNSFILGATKGSATLSPEMTTEFEVGTNLQFFDGRLGIDATYYDRKTEDQIFTLPTEPATGYTSMYTNFGSVTNKGVELALNTTPIKTKDFTWELNFNWSKNNNKVKSLPDGLEGGKSQIARFSAGDDAVYVYAEIGKPLGEFYTYLPTYNDEGQLVVDSNGYPIKGTSVEDTGKNFQNDWTGGVNTSLTWKGITLSAVLDVRYGGYMFSRTKNLMQFTGNGIVTTYNDRNPFIIPNSVYEDGTPNTSPLYLSNSSYQNYFNNHGAGQEGEFYLIDRSFAKLRNVSITWTLPKKWVSKLSLTSIAVSAFCNNAYVWTADDNYYIDPETTSYNYYGDLAAQFGELYSNPACRIWGFNLNVKF